LEPLNGNRWNEAARTNPFDAAVQRFLARLSSGLETRLGRRALPAPPMPRQPRLRPPRRSVVSSWWAARLAVRAGIRLEDFLQHRLARRLADLPVPPTRLPLAIAIDAGGGIACRPVPGRARGVAWLRSFLRANGPAALAPEIHVARAEATELAAGIDTQRRRVEESAGELEKAIAGREVIDPRDEAQARQAGCPPKPLPAGSCLVALAAVLLLAQVWQLAVPFLEAAGIRTRDLGAELAHHPLGVAAGVSIAASVLVGLVLLADLVLREGLALFAALPGPRQRVWRSAVFASFAAVAAALAWSVSGMMPGSRWPAGMDYQRISLVLTILTVPVAVAFLLRLARRLDKARELAIAIRRAWDRQHLRSFREAMRLQAALAEQERRLATLEGQRAAVLQRQRRLQGWAAAARRRAGEAIEAEELALAKVAHGIVAALELDRYEYLRRAGSCPRLAEPLPPVPANGQRRGETPARNLGLAR